MAKKVNGLPGCIGEITARKVKAGDPSSLLTVGEATPGLLCSVLEHPVQERGHTGKNLVKDHDVDVRKCERAGSVKPEEGKAQRDLSNECKHLK